MEKAKTALSFRFSHVVVCGRVHDGVRVGRHRLVRLTGAGDIISEHTSGEGGELANILQKQNRQGNTD